MSKDFGMPEFMVDVNLHDVNSDEFLKLIPSQRAIVNDLLFEGKITSYCVSVDRSKLWITMVANDEEDIIEQLAKFPLINFMDCEIAPLLFYNSSYQTFSHISLN
ncbi:MAG TPA: muconolactone Delta-isomerase family protein [Chitinophagales bacterium]|nr:muconolactone Delta-isomerase family protein [Chitinophagales bacterium]HRG84637.1 muconolactone Delta-isomerase family protein [Chitinophagales bacterium]